LEHNLDVYSIIKSVYPELTDEDFLPKRGKINLEDDGDGIQYISKWEYSKPIPESLKLGK
jgi:hypothetical protein